MLYLFVCTFICCHIPNGFLKFVVFIRKFWSLYLPAFGLSRFLRRHHVTVDNLIVFIKIFICCTLRTSFLTSVVLTIILWYILTRILIFGVFKTVFQLYNTAFISQIRFSYHYTLIYSDQDPHLWCL